MLVYYSNNMSIQNCSEKIAEYFHQGYTYSEIVNLLNKSHNVSISLSTLKRILKNLGLKRKFLDENLEEICSAIITELSGSGSCLGYKTLWRRLKQKYYLDVRRETVLEILRIIDPDGLDDRLTYRLKRRLYQVPGPNFIWHIDGYDKLKPYGFAIHACIDGYSRRVIWLVIGTSNNKPEIILHHYLTTVKKLKYIPTVMRSDCGTENSVVDIVHQALRLDHNDRIAKSCSFMKGKSTANQRIESFWGQLRRHLADFYMTLFKAMRDLDVFSNANYIHVECLRFCFGPIIQNDLYSFRKEWNRHKIRKQKGRELLPGKPNVLYFMPENFGAEDYKKPVDIDNIEYCFTQYSQVPELYSPIFEKMVYTIFPDFLKPTNIEEALACYERIVNQLEKYINTTDEP